MTIREEEKLYREICNAVQKMIPDNTSSEQFFAIYSRLAAYFATETRNYFWAVIDEKDEEENG